MHEVLKQLNSRFHYRWCCRDGFMGCQSPRDTLIFDMDSRRNGKRRQAEVSPPNNHVRGFPDGQRCVAVVAIQDVMT